MAALLLTLAGMVAVLAIRKTDAFLHPQLWAEDGAIFFLQQLELGTRSATETYAGYYHAVPRLIAAGASLVPPTEAPAIYNGAALLVTLGVGAFVFAPRVPLRPAAPFALAIVLAPHDTGEVFVNLTNLQWFLALLLVLVALQRAPRRPREAAADGALVGLCGLTGPFILLAAPLFVERLWRERRPEDAAVAAIAVAAAALQGTALLRYVLESPATGGFAGSAVLPIVGRRLFGDLLAGRTLAHAIAPGVLAAAGAGLAGFAALAVRHDPARRRTVVVLLYVAVALLVAALVKQRANLEVLSTSRGGMRYFFVPGVLLCWAWLVCAFAPIAPRKRALAALALGAALASSLASGFRTSPWPDLHWEPRAARIVPGRPMDIPINPPGWRIPIRWRAGPVPPPDTGDGPRASRFGARRRQGPPR